MTTKLEYAVASAVFSTCYYNYKKIRMLTNPFSYCSKRVDEITVQNWEKLHEDAKDIITKNLYPEKTSLKPGKFVSVTPSYFVTGKAVIDPFYSYPHMKRIHYSRQYNLGLFKLNLTHDFRETEILNLSWPEVSITISK